MKQGRLGVLTFGALCGVVLGCGNTIIVDGGGAGGGGAGSTSQVTSSVSSSKSVSVSTSSATSSVSSAFSSSNVSVSSSNVSVSSSNVSVSSSNVSVSSSVSTSNVSASSSNASVSSSNVSVSSSTTGASTGTSMIPPEWTCSPNFYAQNDGCDCGCGAFDPDCPDTSAGVCQFCGDPGACGPGGACPGNIDPTNNAFCVPGVPEICNNGMDDDFDGLTDCADPDCQGQPGCAPATWTCALNFWKANDGCDCGCGAFDPDCATPLVASCGFCNDAGSCNQAGCPGNINPMQNSTCN